MIEANMINWGKYKKKTNCEHCKVKLKFENTSPASKAKGYCHTCYNDLINKGLIQF